MATARSEGQLVPVPKVYLPALVGVIGVVVNWISSGNFSKTELVGFVLTAVYTAIGYVAPSA